MLLACSLLRVPGRTVNLSLHIIQRRADGSREEGGSVLYPLVGPSGCSETLQVSTTYLMSAVKHIWRRISELSHLVGKKLRGDGG